MTTQPQSSRSGTSKQTYDGVTDLVPRVFFFVTGVKGEYFTTKFAAEVRARKAGFNMAQVYSKRFFEEV